MKVALIAMSILGCDDSGTACKPVATLPERWTTIAACDAASERALDIYTNEAFPMIVAVCQTVSQDAAPVITDNTGQDPAPTTAEPADRSLTDRAIALVTGAIPSADGLKDIVTKPLHLVTDTYSWVARKIGD